ncbi:hypothetical protein P8452_43627 [Trifolium repens]|nr:hypothetical protein QL285_028548 [Trifolium repens]WJX58143.1 hypothetical protein P8452_43627 [Trifolium repens]
MADLHIQNQQQSSMADHLDHHIHTHKTHNTSVKRRSRPSSSSDQRSSKKHSFDQEKLARNGFSAITLPISLCGNVLCGSVSDPLYTLQEQTMPVKGSSGLPPKPPISRCNSEVIDPATVKAVVSSCLKSEENSPPPDSKRLKRMKERLTEMKQWWDEIMKDEEEEDEKEQENEEEKEQEQEEEEKEQEEEEEEEDSLVAEDDKVTSQSQDELRADYEEAISVEWVEKCLSLTFRCPCGKGYEVLISENNCYYKLV